MQSLVHDMRPDISNLRIPSCFKLTDHLSNLFISLILEAKLPDLCPQQITTFLEQWSKLRAAVIEMGPYARMIS